MRERFSTVHPTTQPTTLPCGLCFVLVRKAGALGREELFGEAKRHLTSAASACVSLGSKMD